MEQKKHSISSVQLMFMAIGSALAFPYTIMPILNSPPKNQDVWISLALSVIYILIINLPFLILMNKFRGVDINDTVHMLTGKIGGRVIGILLFLFFMFCLTACLLMAYIFVNIYVLPETPEWAVLLYILVPVSYAAYKGAGTIGRVATFIVPTIIVSIVFFFILGFEEMDINLIKPILADSSIWEVNLGGFQTAARYSEILIFVIFSFFLKKNASINKTYALSLTVFSVLFFLILMPTLLVLGYTLAQNEFNPYFVFSRQLEFYDFIKRVQAVNIIVWFPDIMLKLCMYNYMASYVLSGGVFKTKSYKFFVIPLSVIAFFICLVPMLNNSSTVILLRSGDFFPYAVLPFTFLIPVILLIVYAVRKKKINEKLKEKLEKKPDTENG